MTFTDAAQRLGVQPAMIVHLLSTGELQLAQHGHNEIDDRSVEQLYQDIYGWAEKAAQSDNPTAT